MSRTTVTIISIWVVVLAAATVGSAFIFSARSSNVAIPSPSQSEAPSPSPTTSDPEPSPPPTDISLMPAGLDSIIAPAMCDRPAGALVDGELPGIPAGDGMTTIETTSDASPAPLWAAGASTGSGMAYAVGFACDRGGVAWPDTIGVYDAQLDPVGSFDLGALDEMEHSRLESLTFSAEGLIATWFSYDGAGFGRCDPNDVDLRSASFALADEVATKLYPTDSAAECLGYFGGE